MAIIYKWYGFIAISTLASEKYPFQLLPPGDMYTVWFINCGVLTLTTVFFEMNDLNLIPNLDQSHVIQIIFFKCVKVFVFFSFYLVFSLAPLLESPIAWKELEVVVMD